MQKTVALLLGTFLPVVGFSGTAQAQSSVQVQGTVQAVDCKAQTIVLSSPGASNTVAAAPYTAVLVNSTSVPFCSLQQYIGASATAWLVASGNEFIATRIDVHVAAASVPAAPVFGVGVVVAPIVVAPVFPRFVVVPAFSSFAVVPAFSSFVVVPTFSSFVVLPVFSSFVVAPRFERFVVAPGFHHFGGAPVFRRFIVR